ncbi:carbon dioxide concentrating mechanism/carboxysome shell protein [Rubidibacter lacunae KORDI 51-2]|uniref:Carboxysome shell protein CcmK n=1 Tax=Rubidibacter lacunae KORDI 51-2 TaxID=582515 RepID=U5D9E2_9CHRO|nr:carbon dioxide-concentrating mechanism protein CcmK [Rubidibacter lacunae]ERN41208.1 carbon dioxide concentrating mechanism/carboxysome shell protein [Rubidibacter lacunae KORDI 51-2]
MPIAVGVIQTLGFPAVLASADAMVKAARVALVTFDKAERGQFFVAIRGNVAEVKTAMAAGIEAAEASFGGEVLTHYIIPNPPENLEAVMPIDYTEQSEPFRL